MLTDAVKQELAKKDKISIIDLIDFLIEKAQERGASDIHISPTLEGMQVRLRIDGTLNDYYTFPSEIQSEVVARIKVLANLRTDEHQAAHDGRFRYMLKNGGFVDIRVSISPTYRGESIVLRLLSSIAEQYTLETLGFSKEDEQKILTAIKRPSGMILVTGPTGSGKTTTLYTLIRMLNTKDVSIVTIEDPIEYGIERVEQIQVNQRVGLTFASGLRTILRQDPNIIMVGEIRDSETASIAVNTALTGHLLFSTLHTNDAATTLPRLLDMKVEAFLVASTINIAIGQRLVRKICTHCKKEFKVAHDLAESLASVPLKKRVSVGDVFYHGEGCASCDGSGYAGRISINEVLVADAKIREAILKKASSNELRQIAIKNGMTTMLEDGFTKVRSGQTTVEEILRVVHEET